MKFTTIFSNGKTSVFLLGKKNTILSRDIFARGKLHLQNVLASSADQSNFWFSYIKSLKGRQARKEELSMPELFPQELLPMAN